MSMIAIQRMSGSGHVFIAAGNDRLFSKVCDALHRPELKTDPRFLTNADRVRHRSELHAALEARTSLMRSGEVVAALRTAGAPCSELNDIAQAIGHEQVRTMGMLVDLPSAAVPDLKVVPLPLRVNGRRPAPTSPPPMLGADTDSVLHALGIGDDEIARLRREGVIA